MHYVNQFVKQILVGNECDTQSDSNLGGVSQKKTLTFELLYFTKEKWKVYQYLGNLPILETKTFKKKDSRVRTILIMH